MSVSTSPSSPDGVVAKPERFLTIACDFGYPSRSIVHILGKEEASIIKYSVSRRFFSPSIGNTEMFEPIFPFRQPMF